MGPPPVLLDKFVIHSQELVPALELPAQPPSGRDAAASSTVLGSQDCNMLFSGWFGLGLVYSEALELPALRMALSAALARMPWLAGRMTQQVGPSPMREGFDYGSMLASP